MERMTPVLLATSVLLLAACAARLTGTPVPAALDPAGQRLSERVAAKGVQIYECRAKPGAPDAAQWVFVAPEAELLDARGSIAGTHYAGPHWESRDGSKIVGSVTARADAPRSAGHEHGLAVERMCGFVGHRGLPEIVAGRYHAPRSRWC